MMGARHSCPVPSDSTGSSSLPEKGQDDRVSTLVQVVSTQCFKYKTERSSTVDTGSGSVDTRDSSQKLSGSNWDSVSTLAQVVSTQCFKYKAKRSSSVDTGSGSVDTRDSSQKLSRSYWDSVSTLAQVVSTLEAFPEHLLGCFGTVCRH
ncbi:hypothetical protein Taro_000143 [Colocasia esculenta]|uniref:Uncharacterized protein n=1 Tax=Colocasia esculenta TaxID=4460 RepID=A0A843TB67_COLES|nr:hypothetical protein [Colocasia esculenta]